MTSIVNNPILNSAAPPIPSSAPSLDVLLKGLGELLLSSAVVQHHQAAPGPGADQGLEDWRMWFAKSGEMEEKRRKMMESMMENMVICRPKIWEEVVHMPGNLPVEQKIKWRAGYNAENCHFRHTEWNGHARMWPSEEAHILRIDQFARGCWIFL